VVLGVALAMSKSNDNDQTAAPTQIGMPKLQGLTPKEAQAELERVGLKTYTASDENKKDCTGTVTEQNPGPGTTVALTQPVTFKVCNPLAAVTVPNDLQGVSAGNAEARLSSLGLTPKIQRVNSTAEKDRVLEVEKAGQKVDPGTTITIKVSNNALVKVPDVENKSFDAAQALLESQDLIAEQIDVQADGTPGTVIKQLTEAGKEVKRNSKVQLQVIVEAGNPEPSGSASAGPGGGAGTGTGEGDD
jgi:serine/threonine-protein kinase